MTTQFHTLIPARTQTYMNHNQSQIIAGLENKTKQNKNKNKKQKNPQQQQQQNLFSSKLSKISHQNCRFPLCISLSPPPKITKFPSKS